MEFSELLGFIRKKEGLSQTKFGELLGLGQQAISDLETGKNQPSKRVLAHLKYRYRDENYLLSYIETTCADQKKKFVKETIEVFGKIIFELDDPKDQWYFQAVQEIFQSGEDATIEALKANISQFHEKIKDREWMKKMENKFNVLQKEIENIKSLPGIQDAK